MAYTTIDDPTIYFNTKLYSGNGGTQSITGVGFQPDWTWIKQRTGTTWHNLYDAVRGATKAIASNDTGAEETRATGLTAFDSDGFSLGSDSNANAGSGSTYASWNWKANGQGSSNTDGSINTTYTSVNTTAGFSISKYVGTGSLATVGHGLGVAPAMIIIKNLDTTNGWEVYHQSLGNTKYLQLHSDGTGGTSATRWNNTSPTNSVFTVNTENGVNKSGSNIIAYCFAKKTGYSKFGLYTGNDNADGPFIYTGFKPAFVIVKKTSASGYWVINDNKRNNRSDTISNPSNKWLYPNVSNATFDASSYPMDLLSNGFKIRHTGGYQNTANTYLYMALGQTLVGSNNIPATAR